MISLITTVKHQIFVWYIIWLNWLVVFLNANSRSSSTLKCIYIWYDLYIYILVVDIEITVKFANMCGNLMLQHCLKRSIRENLT